MQSLKIGKYSMVAVAAVMVGVVVVGVGVPVAVVGLPVYYGYRLVKRASS